MPIYNDPMNVRPYISLVDSSENYAEKDSSKCASKPCMGKKCSRKQMNDRMRHEKEMVKFFNRIHEGCPGHGNGEKCSAGHMEVKVHSQCVQDHWVKYQNILKEKGIPVPSCPHGPGGCTDMDCK